MTLLSGNSVHNINKSNYTRLFPSCTKIFAFYYINLFFTPGIYTGTTYYSYIIPVIFQQQKKIGPKYAYKYVDRSRPNRFKGAKAKIMCTLIKS